MTTVEATGASQRQEELEEAIYRHATVTLSCRLVDGWASFRSRFLGSSGETRQLVVAYPLFERLCPPEFAGGETVGVAFRQGYRRCVFNSIVIRQCRFSMARSVHVSALVLARPDVISAMQRRLYYRTPVPPGTRIEVAVRKASRVASVDDATMWTGELLDISLGGMSVGFVGGELPQWRRDQLLSCIVSHSACGDPLHLSARVCHCEETDPGQLRAGLQLTELDAGQDRAGLQRLIDMCTEFQRIETHRLGADLY